MPNPQDQAALEWAKANPKDPRSQAIQAKIWASNNPDDPRSSQIMDKLSKKDTTPPSQAPQPNPFDVAQTQDKTVEQETGDSPLKTFLKGAAQAFAGSVAGTVKAGTLGNVDLSKPLKLNNIGQGAESASDALGSVAMGGAMGSTLPSSTNALGRIGIGSLAGGTIGGLSKPSSPIGGRLNGAAEGALAGGLLGTGLEAGNAVASGLGRAASVANKALGMSQGNPELQDQARQGLRQGMSALFSNHDNGMGYQEIKKIRQLSTQPLSSLTSSNPDKTAMINTLSQAGDGQLSDLADQLRSAKKINDSPMIKGPTQLLKQGLKGAGKSMSGPSGALNDPQVLSALLNSIKQNQE